MRNIEQEATEKAEMRLSSISFVLSVASGSKKFDSLEQSGDEMWPGEIDLCPDALYLCMSGRAAKGAPQCPR
jgi:hypothetical protein